MLALMLIVAGFSNRVAFFSPITAENRQIAVDDESEPQ